MAIEQLASELAERGGLIDDHTLVRDGASGSRRHARWSRHLRGLKITCRHLRSL
ncbi:hypothetical protein [Pseudomonas sp. LRF_L74]|uniref:hypothetical protein n=1 Tax=Pseudomonas sp. LRF_L74 TaxID=3369422 RepID=UPI003F5D937F